MNLETLQYFVTVYEVGSIPKAAEFINISSQGLGKAIRQIENYYGVSLFDKQNGKVIPTPIAEQLYPKIRMMLEVDEQVRGQVKTYLMKDKIRFAVPTQYQVGYYLKKHITQYNKSFGAEIECVPISYTVPIEEQDLMLINGVCDYRILNGMFNQLEGFKTCPLCSLYFIPVVSCRNPLARLDSPQWADMKNQIIVVENVHYPYVQQLISICRKNGFDPNIQEAEGDLFILDLIREEKNIVYYTKHPSAVGRLDGENPEVKILDLHPVVKSDFIIQGRKEKWNRHLVKYLQNAMRNESDRWRQKGMPHPTVRG